MSANPDAKTLLAAALAYAAASLPVFPCNRNKEPLTEHGFLDATTDPDIIQTWWKRLPGALIGIAIPAGYVVVDVDGPDGWASLKGDGLSLDDTLTAVTGRGEWHRHLWYSLPEGVTVAPKVGLLHGVDIRGQGSYVIAPPSRSVFGPYTWVGGFDLAHVAPAPEWVLERCAPSRPPGQARPAEEWTLMLRGPVPEGHRHETLLRVTGLLLRRHDATIAVELARAWAEARLVPPLPEPEAARILRDALHLEQRRLARQSGGGQ